MKLSNEKAQQFLLRGIVDEMGSERRAQFETYVEKFKKEFDDAKKESEEKKVTYVLAFTYFSLELQQES